MSGEFPQVHASLADIRAIKDQIAQCRAKIYEAERQYIDTRAELERVQSEQMKNIDQLLEVAGNVMIHLGQGVEALPRARSFG